MIDITKSESGPCYSSSDCRTFGLGEGGWEIQTMGGQIRDKDGDGRKGGC